MKTTALLLGCLLLSTPSSAAPLQDWMKQLGRQRGKKSAPRHTSVAAVRGLSEPGDIDPAARDFDAVKEMESRAAPSEVLDQFIREGALKPKAAIVPGGDLSEAAARQFAAASLPQKIKTAARPISTQEEIQIGRDVAANIAAQFGLLEHPALNAYVQLVGRTVARSAPRKDIVYHFAVLDTDIVNAFAAPGGYIFITKGLLKTLSNEAQLACVLGHEIAHVSNKHVIREIQKSNLAQAMIPSYVKASAQKAQWMNQIADLSIQMLWKGLSREDELESDHQGVGYAAAGGYDAQTFRETLERLKSEAADPQESKNLKFLLSSHPKPEDRLAALTKTFGALPEEGAVLKERFQKEGL